jgi:peptidoglycan/LPS O-acetylase OafA/YrhL
VPGVFGGYLGVDIFFVLSGFLITSLLLQEVARTGTVDFRRFFARRLVRLMPPLVCMLVLYTALAPLTWPSYLHHFRDAAIAAVYLTDFSMLADSLPKMISHTWSLSVEQHYYLLWPAIVLGIMRRYPGRVVPLIATLYVVATAWRVYGVVAESSWEAVYYRFDFRLSGLMLGSLLATTLQSPLPLPSPSPVRTAIVTFLAGIGLSALAWKDPLGILAGVWFAEVLAVVMILHARHAGQSLFHTAVNAPLMIYIGRISYGLYLYHYPVFYFLREHFPWYATLAIGLPASLGLAALSYHTIETLARKPRSAVSALASQ